MANTRVEVVSPTRTLFSGEAEMVACRTLGGEIAFLANHMPFIGVLDICVLRLIGPVAGEATGPASAAAPEIRIAVRGGFVEVRDNQVTVVAGGAELPDDVDVEAANRDRQDSAGDGGDVEREAVQRWAAVRLEVAGQ
jgi:F-type H+-transporting ATPase subunit epsilon